MHKVYKTTASVDAAAKMLGEFELLHQDNWWNNMRLRLVQYVLDQLQATSLLDFGCGKGVQLAKLKKSHPFIHYVGYEPYLISKQIDSSIPLVRDLNSCSIRRFDVITALDVIEHIEDDLQALRQMHSLLATDGTLIIHVPTYLHLWCLMDTMGGHYRRYTKKNLVAVVRQAGFKIEEAFYIFPYAYPGYALRTLSHNLLEFFSVEQNEKTVMKYLPIDPLKILSRLTRLELALIKKTKYRSPFGTSLFLYATKM